MNRTYNKNSKKLIVRALKNSIKAVESGLITHAGELARVSALLRQLASTNDDEGAKQFDDWATDPITMGEKSRLARRLANRVLLSNEGWEMDFGHKTVSAK